MEIENQNIKKEFQDDALYQFGVIRAGANYNVKNPKFDTNFPVRVIRGDIFKKLKVKDFYEYMQKNPDKLPVALYHCYIEGMTDVGRPQMKYFDKGQPPQQQNSLSDDVSEQPKQQFAPAPIPVVIPDKKNDIDFNKYFEQNSQTQRELIDRQFNSTTDTYKDIIAELKSQIVAQKEQVDRAYQQMSEMRNGENNSPMVQFVEKIQDEKMRMIETHHAENIALKDEFRKREDDLRNFYTTEMQNLKTSNFENYTSLQNSTAKKISELEEIIEELEIEKNDLLGELAELKAEVKLMEESATQKDEYEAKVNETLSGLEDTRRQVENSNSLMGLLSQHGAVLLPIVGNLVTMLTEKLTAKDTPTPYYPPYPPPGGQNYPPYQQQFQPPFAPPQENQQLPQNEISETEKLLKQNIKKLLEDNGEIATDEAVNNAYAQYLAKNLGMNAEPAQTYEQETPAQEKFEDTNIKMRENRRLA